MFTSPQRPPARRKNMRVGEPPEGFRYAYRYDERLQPAEPIPRSLLPLRDRSADFAGRTKNREPAVSER